MFQSDMRVEMKYKIKEEKCFLLSCFFPSLISEMEEYVKKTTLYYIEYSCHLMRL